MLAALRKGAGHAALAALHAGRRLIEVRGRQDELRVINLHGTIPWSWPRLDRLINALDEFGGIASASDWSKPGRFLLTFDDGYDNNFEYAERLSARSMSCLYFVVPSFIDRTTAQYLAYHRDRAVEGYVPVDELGSARGLSREQVRALTAMGHVIGAHNFSHRSLGSREPAVIRYEIDESLEALREILGAPVQDFALAFGYRRDVSPEALTHLIDKRVRVHTALRGPAPRSGSRLIHRTGLDPMMPLSTCLESALGTLDRLTAQERAGLEEEWRARGGDA